MVTGAPSKSKNATTWSYTAIGTVRPRAGIRVEGENVKPCYRGARRVQSGTKKTAFQPQARRSWGRTLVPAANQKL
jgi:hypothetical protein